LQNYCSKITCFAIENINTGFNISNNVLTFNAKLNYKADLSSENQVSKDFSCDHNENIEYEVLNIKITQNT